MCRSSAPIRVHMRELTPRWELAVPAEPPNIAQIRGGVTDFASQHGAERSLVGEIALAVTEAATNAILHAFVDAPPGTVRAVAETGDGVIVVSVVDDGCGMMPRADSPGLGLGLPTIGQLTAGLDIRPGDDGRGTEVRMTFTAPGVRGPDPAASESDDGRVQVLGEVARLVEQGGWPGEGVERLIDLLVPRVADAAAIDLVDQDGRPARLGARVADDAALSEWLAAREPRADQIDEVEAALREGDWRLLRIEGDLLAKIAKDNEDARRLGQIGAAWWVNLPLGSGATLLGSLGLGLRAERGDPTEQRGFLEALAERVAGGLANTRLVAELRRTRKRLESVLNALGEAVVVCDGEGEVVYANAAAAALIDGPHEVVRTAPLDDDGSFVVNVIEPPRATP